MLLQCVKRHLGWLGASLLALGLLVSSPILAGLTETSAGELYLRWQQLPRQQQLPALAELVAFYSRHDTARAIALAEQALRHGDAGTEPELIATIRNDRAFAWFMNAQATLALEEAIAIERLADQHRLPAVRGRARMIQGYVYRNANLPEQALIAQQKALQDYEQVDEPERRGWILKALATVLVDMRQFSQAEDYLQQLEQLAEQEPTFLSLRGGVAEVRGLIASVSGEHQTALQHYRQALDYAEQNGDVLGQHVFHAAIGHEFLRLQQPEQALRSVRQGLKLMQATGAAARDVNLLRVQANALSALQRDDEAVVLLKQLAERARQRNDQANMLVLWQDLYELEKRRGRPVDALHYLEQARAAELLVTGENNTQRAALLDAAFDNERKGRQIELLQAENRVQQLELERRQQQLIAGISVALFLFGAISFFYLRRQHQLELQRQQQLNSKLRELDAVKDRMLANTSHELRTPLNGIVGLSDLLLAEELEPGVREYVELIADSGRRLTRVVTDLLESARLSEGQIRLHYQPVDMAELVHRAVLISTPLAQPKQLQLLEALSPPLPEVMADPARIEQVLINLLNNAIKFTEHGQIRITAKREPNRLKLLICDSGIGVPPELRTRIFESFFQVDASASRRYEGTGLGLAICKQLIELHGGEIGIDDNVQGGSTFWFTLPLAVPDAVMAAAS